MAFSKNEIRRFAILAGHGTATGTNVYDVTIPEIIAYAPGLRIAVKFTNGNTSTTTINVNGLGVKTVRKQVTSELVVNDIRANEVKELVYDGTGFQLMGAPITGYSNSTGNNLFNYLNFR